MQGQKLERYKDVIAKRPDVTGTDEFGNPINQSEKQEFVTFDEMLATKAKFDAQLRVKSTPVIIGKYSGTGDVQYWGLKYAAPDGHAYITGIGDIDCEMAEPFGWLDSDRDDYYIGVGGAGSLQFRKTIALDDGTLKTEDTGSLLPFKFLPDRRPDPPPPPAITEKPAGIPFGDNSGQNGGGFTGTDQLRLAVETYRLVREMATRQGIL